MSFYSYYSHIHMTLAMIALTEKQKTSYQLLIGLCDSSTLELPFLIIVFIICLCELSESAS